MAKRLIFLLFVMAVRIVSLSSYTLLSSFYPHHIKKWPYDVHRSSEYTGYVVASFSPTFVLGSLVVGHIASSKAVSYKFCLVSGLFLAGGASTLLGALTYTTEWVELFWFSVALRLTIGFGVAFVDVSSFAMVVASYSDNVGLASGLLELTWSLAIMVGPPLGGILYQSFGFLMPSAAVGISMLLLDFVCFFLPIPTRLQASLTGIETSRYSCRKLHSFWTLMSNVAAFMVMMCLAFPQAALSDFLGTKFHLSPGDVGFVFLACSLPYAVLTPIVGKLCDVLTPRWFVTSGLLVAGGGFFLMSFGNTIVLQVTAQAVIGIGQGLTYASCFTDIYKEVCHNVELDELDEAITGKLYGTFTGAVLLGEMVGSGLGGLSAERLGFDKAAVVYGGLVSSFGALYLTISLIARAWQVRREN